uniref:Uncharacterized protein n=1 Tax=Candidatus Kentrum sp. SD TaxID=2126332 RepID=A0A451BMW9_9GAMM|nr:MAG: hypothetical protein BECKSD772D_GA0070982_105826 [Candidatus Kentron sp. SD]
MRFVPHRILRRLDWKQPDEGGKAVAYKIQRREGDSETWLDAGLAMGLETTLSNQPVEARNKLQHGYRKHRFVQIYRPFLALLFTAGDVKRSIIDRPGSGYYCFGGGKR